MVLHRNEYWNDAGSNSINKVMRCGGDYKKTLSPAAEEEFGNLEYQIKQ
jgi:hypothetical protein